MACFLTWGEWKIREDNARKRQVRAALNGTGVPLVGSAATCPSTNPRAMKSAMKTGVVKKLPIDETDTSPRPDYTFDRWIQKANEFGDDINKMRTNVDKEDQELDKKRKKAEDKASQEDKKAEKETPKDQKDSEDKDSEKEMSNKDKDPVWSKLRGIHQDVLKKLDKPKPEDD